MKQVLDRAPTRWGRLARLAPLVLALSACTDECPPGANPGSLFCHAVEVDAGEALDGAIDPCPELSPGVPCGAALTCSSILRCSCGDGVVDEGEECDEASDNAAGAGCEPSCVRSCDEDRGCPESSNPCRDRGVCDLDTFTCRVGAPIPAGTPCDEGRVCDGEGSCVGCGDAGTGCEVGDPCRRGEISCESGAARCEDLGPREPGTPCGVDAVCNPDAVCIPCRGGASCTGSQPCVEANLDCASGSPVCVDGTLRAAGTPCADGAVCAPDGSCVACEDGMSCASADPCRVAAVDCSVGTPRCQDGPRRPAGAPCGADLVCTPDGECAACREGEPCTPRDAPCFDGVIRCASGRPVCEATLARPERSTCEGTRLCTADSRCVQCLAPTDCPTFGGEGLACDDPITCQGSRGDRTCSASGTCGTVSGVPDDRACTSDTLALECGLFRDIYCTGEEAQTPPRCPERCTSDAECDPGAHCDGMTCVPTLPPGAPCARTPECGGGRLCVDGVCCTSACSGTCARCNLPGLEGTCSAIPFGADPDAECGAVDCNGWFAGFEGASCRRRASVADGACDGTGACLDASWYCPRQGAGAVTLTCDGECQSPTGGTCLAMTPGMCTNLDRGPRSCGVGACRRTVAWCSGGVANVCTPGTPAAEICNDVDDDCDGVTDEGCDDDGDGYCDASIPYVGSFRCPNGPGDCNDDNPMIYPGAPDPCDRVDRDCDGKDGPPGVICGVCGDGFIDPAYGEVCDDGNRVSGDGCRGDCLAIECDGGSTGATRLLTRGTTCYWHNPNVVSRPNAISACAARNAYLMEWRNNPAERDAVWGPVHPSGGSTRVWIGLQRNGANDPAPANWRWDVEGQAVTVDELNWRSGEPSGDGICVEWGGSGGNILNDINCNSTRDFICKRPRRGVVR